MKHVVVIALVLVLVGCDSETRQFAVRPTATEIDSPARHQSTVPHLYADAGGVLFLTWTQRDEAQHTLYFSMLQQEAWSRPQRIAGGPHWFVNWADVPMIAADGAGGLIANYLVRSGTKTYGYNLNVVVSSDRGSSWLGPLVPHDDRSQTEHGFAALLPTADGEFLVAWLDGRNNTWGARQTGGSMGLRAAFVDRRGELKHEGPIDLRVCDCCQPAAVRTARGPAVVYRDRSGDEIRDIVIAWWENGAWTGPSPVARDNWRIDGCPVDGPRADAIGNQLAVTWFTAADGEPRVQAAFSGDSGTRFTPPLRADDGNPVGRADIVLLNENTAVVSWLEAGADAGELRIRKVHRDGKREASVAISGMSLSRSSGFPQLEKRGERIYLAWTEGDGIRTASAKP